jgi:hypothetical protein
MKSNDLLIVLAVAAAVYFFRSSSTGPQPQFMVCKYPDGTTIQVPSGNACPVDPTHGGQSYPCYSTSPGAINPGVPWGNC